MVDKCVFRRILVYMFIDSVRVSVNRIGSFFGGIHWMLWPNPQWRLCRSRRLGGLSQLPAGQDGLLFRENSTFWMAKVCLGCRVCLG